MFITRTPFRVSLFGGGTDISEYFRINGGQVISFAINKYCYVTARQLPEISEHNVRLSYSKIETCKDISDLKHPLVRAALEDLKISKVEIHYDADLPTNSGLGTSSAFAVGLINSLSALQGKYEKKEYLAKKAIYWERYLLKEKGGYQDQIASAFGGINNIKFFDKSSFKVHPILLSKEQIKELASRFLLVYIPKFRLSNDYSVGNFLNEKKTIEKLDSINSIADEAKKYLDMADFDNLGKLLDKSWHFKRSISNVTNKVIDEVYEETKNAGAIGSKLLGAGGGGFMLAWCREGEANKIQKILREKNLYSLKIEIDIHGSKFLYSIN